MSELPRTVNILLGCTGSVATIKICQLIKKLFEVSEKQGILIKIKVVTTKSAQHFFNPNNIMDIKDVELYHDEDEWTWCKLSDPVLHIELRKWADLFLIAPLDANTLAKLVNGICDNLLTCVARAWDLSKPFFFCPAMNTFMWDHPLTVVQINNMKSYGYIEIPCISKKLACGDEGFGAMAEVDEIVRVIAEKIFIKT